MKQEITISILDTITRKLKEVEYSPSVENGTLSAKTDEHNNLIIEETVKVIVDHEEHIYGIRQHVYHKNEWLNCKVQIIRNSDEKKVISDNSIESDKSFSTLQYEMA